MLKVCIVLGALLLSPIAVAAAEALVTLERGQAYEASWHADKGQWVTRVYIANVRKPSKIPIEVSVRSVALGSRTDPRLTGLFQVSPTRIDSPAAGVDLLVPKDPAVLPATYQATLVFQSGEENQTANIQLTVPPATLSGPPNLQLTRVLFSPFSVDNPKLEIWEVSGKSPADVRVHQSEPFAGSDHQVTGQILLNSGNVAQSGFVELPYTLTGDFPLGAVSSKIIISADQVSTSLVIPVQVHTRLTRLVLVAIIVIGLTLGFLTRTVLKPRIDIGEARKRAADAVAKLTEYAKLNDETFRSQILKTRKDLELAVQAATATGVTIADAIKAAEDTRQAALADLTSRLKKAEQEMSALAEIVTPAWTLPENLADTFAAPRQAVDRAKQLLSSADAEGALTMIRGAQGEFREALRGKVENWHNLMTRRLRELESLPSLIEADRRGEFEKGLQALRETLPSLDIPPDAEPSALKAALRAIHGDLTTLRGFVPAIAGEAGATFRGMDDILSDMSLKKKARWDDARNATDEFVGGLKSLDVGSSDDWPPIGPHAAKLLHLWEDALASQKPQAEGVSQAFAAGHYSAAAEALEKAVGGGTAGTTMGEGLPSSNTVLGFVATQEEPQLEETATPESAAIKVEPPPAIPNEPFGIFVAHSMRELLLAKLAQATVSWIALTLIGYLIFVDKFVGSSGDLLSAFFWGFTTDIGVDGLLAAARSKQP